MTRPAVPLPGTNCSSMPRSQARRRTAGDAIGLSPGGRDAGATATDSVARGGGRGPALQRAPARPVPRCAGRGAASLPGGCARRRRRRRGRRPPAALPSALPAPATSMRISSLPTAITWPTLPPSASTVPATGEGISTVALSVITSARTWSSATASPGLHVPFHQLHLGDAFADVRHLDDVHAHVRTPPGTLQRQGRERGIGSFISPSRA